MNLWLPQAASSYAQDLDWILIFITVIVGAWFVVAELLLLVLVIRYRRREGVKAAYLPGHSLRAMAVVLVPCAVILGLDLVIDGVAAPIWDHVKVELPPHDELIGIRGEQWAWRFVLAGPDGRLGTGDDIDAPGEVHVPVGSVVQFELSAKDVLHSFFVPELRLKQDAIPGRKIKGWFKVTRPGSYEVICAEICGFGHTLMKGKMVAESPQAYRQWLRSKQAAAKAPVPHEEKDNG